MFQDLMKIVSQNELIDIMKNNQGKMVCLADGFYEINYDEDINCFVYHQDCVELIAEDIYELEAEIIQFNQMK